MLVRRETPDDVVAVRDVVVGAFCGPDPESEPVEARLLDRLRACQEWLPALSLVAADGGNIVGHVVCTRGWVDEVEVVGLGPLAVRPDRQKQGIGSALMHAVLGAAEALEVPAVVLLGSTVYYSRFGFVPGSLVGIASPNADWGDFFQVRMLARQDFLLVGEFRYAEPFRTAG